MPRIINAYADNSSLASSLKDLGEAIYGDQAKNEVYRQKAFGSKRENDNIPLLADAVARGDRDAIARFGVMSNKTGQDTGDFNRLGVSNHASGVDDPRLALATMGAGGAFSSTAPGQGRDLANRTGIANIGANASRDVAHIQADKQAASDKYKFDNTYENTYDPESGHTVLTPRSQAAGREVAPTKDSVVGGMLRRVATGQQPGTASTDPFGDLSPRIQKIAGVDLPEQNLIEPRSGATGISRDGGQTVILPDGRKVPATGFQPVGQETALTAARDLNVRDQAAKPLPPAPTAYPDVAKDAALTSGLKAGGQAALNETFGAFGLGEPFAGVNRARENLTNQAQATRELIASAPGRAAVMDKKWADKLIPQPGMLGMTGINADEEKNRSVSLTNHLREMYGIVQQDAINPNTPPAERVKMEAYLRNLGHAIQLREKVTPEAGAQPPAPPSAPAGAAVAAPAAKPPQVVQNGHTYNLQPDGSYQ